MNQNSKHDKLAGLFDDDVVDDDVVDDDVVENKVFVSKHDKLAGLFDDDVVDDDVVEDKVFVSKHDKLAGLFDDDVVVDDVVVDDKPVDTTTKGTFEVSRDYSDVGILERIDAHIPDAGLGYIFKKGWDVGKFSFWGADPEFNLEENLKLKNIDKEDKHFFASCVNQEQFDDACNYLVQEKEKENILLDESSIQSVLYSLLSYPVDPVNAALVASMFIPGVGTAVAGLGFASRMVLMGAMAGLEKLIFGKTKQYIEGKKTEGEVIIEGAAAAVTATIFAGFIEGAVAVSKPIMNAASQMKKIISNIFQKKPLDICDLGTIGVNGKAAAEYLADLGFNKGTSYQQFLDKFEISPAVKLQNSKNQEIVDYSKIMFGVRDFTGEKTVLSGMLPINKEIALVRAEGSALLNDVAKLGKEYFKRTNQPVQQLYLETSMMLSSVNRNVFKEGANLEKLQRTFPEATRIARQIIDLTDEYISIAKKGGLVDRNFGVGPIKIMKTPEQPMIVSDIDGYRGDGVVSEGYVHRVYKKEMVLKKQDKLRDILVDNYFQNYPTNLNYKEGLEYAERTIQGMMGDISLSFDSSATYAFHERTVPIHDRVLFELGVLDTTSFMKMTDAWLPRIIHSRFNMMAKAKGYNDWEHAINALRSNMEAERILLRSKGGTLAQIEQLEERQQKELGDLIKAEHFLKGMLYKSRGTKISSAYGNVIDFVKDAYVINTGATLQLSSLPDIGGVVMQQGFRQAFKGVKKAFSDNVDEIRSAFPWLVDEVQAREVLEKVNLSLKKKWHSKASDKFATYTGLRKVTEKIRHVLVEYEYSRIIETCMNYRKDLAENADLIFLRKYGLDEGHMFQIADAFRFHGKVDELGYHFVHPDFLDFKLKRQIVGALYSEIKKRTMYPEIGSMPYVMTTKIGSLLSTYKSFPFLLHTNIIMPILRGEMGNEKWIKGVITTMGISIVGRHIKALLYNRKIDYNKIEDWQYLLGDSWLQAGGFGELFDVTLEVGKAVKYKDTRFFGKISPVTQWIGQTAGALANVVSGNKPEQGITLIPTGRIFYKHIDDSSKSKKRIKGF